MDAENPPLRIFFGKAPLGIAERDYASRLQTWREWQPVSERRTARERDPARDRRTAGIPGGRDRAGQCGARRLSAPVAMR